MLNCTTQLVNRILNVMVNPFLVLFLGSTSVMINSFKFLKSWNLLKWPLIIVSNWSSPNVFLFGNGKLMLITKNFRFYNEVQYIRTHRSVEVNKQARRQTRIVARS